MRAIKTDTNLPVSSISTIDSGISLRDIVFVLFRRRWYILAVALPIILIGGFGLSSQTGTFTASSRVVVELVKVDLPRWNTSGRAVDYDRELSTLFNIAMSLPVAKQAAAALVDSIPVMMSLDPMLLDLDQEGMLSVFLQDGLDVSIVGESAILEFSFTSAHPRISLMSSGALRDAFIEFNVHGRKNFKAIAYYEEQITSVRAEMDSLLFHRGQILTDSGYTSLKDELRYESGRVADLMSQLSEAVVVRQSLSVEYNLLKSYMDGDPRNFPMGPDENRSHTLVHWHGVVGKYDDQLSAVLIVHTEDSVAAMNQRKLIDSALTSLRREQENYLQSFHLSLQAAIARENTIKAEISKIKLETSHGPTVYQHVSLLDTEIGTLRELFKDLQSKRGEVRLSQMADERVSSVVPLTNPEMSTIISGGKTVVYSVVIFFFALALGVVVAFIVENMDHRIYSPRDIEDRLNLPVFASVSKVD